MAALDAALRSAPKRDDHAFAKAVSSLCALREELARLPMSGAAADPARRDRLNAVISVALAGNYPLGDVPWEEIRLARGWLAELLDQGGQASPLDDEHPEGRAGTQPLL